MTTFQQKLAFFQNLNQQKQAPLPKKAGELSKNPLVSLSNHQSRPHSPPKGNANQPLAPLSMQPQEKSPALPSIHNVNQSADVKPSIVMPKMNQAHKMKSKNPNHLLKPLPLPDENCSPNVPQPTESPPPLLAKPRQRFDHGNPENKGFQDKLNMFQQINQGAPIQQYDYEGNHNKRATLPQPLLPCNDENKDENQIENQPLEPLPKPILRSTKKPGRRPTSIPIIDPKVKQ